MSGMPPTSNPPRGYYNSDSPNRRGRLSASEGTTEYIGRIVYQRNRIFIFQKSDKACFERNGGFNLFIIPASEYENRDISRHSSFPAQYFQCDLEIRPAFVGTINRYGPEGDDGFSLRDVQQFRQPVYRSAEQRLVE